MEMDPTRSPQGGERSPADSPLTNEEWEALRGRLKAAVTRACPHWLVEQVEDIVQVVLVQLLETLRKSEGKRGFSSIYLAKAAHGATVDEIRRRSRRREIPEQDVSVPESNVGGGPNPERDSAARELGRGVQDCLTRMVYPRRLAVILHLHGCTVPETARRFRWTAKKAENLVYRGLKDLRQCLAAKGFAP
jgi:RNA polymerase sigma-70 factor (ECF subfamily)